MANLIIKENGKVRTAPAVHGEEITIQTPCDCSAVTGVQIAGVEYPFYDAAGKPLATGTGLFSEGSLIRVLIDAVNTRATIINHAVTPASIGASPAWELISDIVVNKNKYGDGVVIFPKGFDASPYEYIMLDTDITFSVTPLEYQEVDVDYSVSLYSGMAEVVELCSALSDTLDVTATDTYKAKNSYSVNSSYLLGNNNRGDLLMWSNYVTSNDIVMVIGAPVSNPTESFGMRYSLTGTVKVYGKKWGI